MLVVREVEYNVACLFCEGFSKSARLRRMKKNNVFFFFFFTVSVFTCVCIFGEGLEKCGDRT